VQDRLEKAGFDASQVQVKLEVGEDEEAKYLEYRLFALAGFLSDFSGDGGWGYNI
jgi:hypothetical protein